MSVMANAGIVCLMAVGIVWASWQLGKLPKEGHIQYVYVREGQVNK